MLVGKYFLRYKHFYSVVERRSLTGNFHWSALDLQLMDNHLYG